MNNQKLIFQITDWFSGDYENNDSEETSTTDESEDDGSQYKKYKPITDTTKYKIYIFGKDQLDKTYTLEVTGLTPYV